MAEIPVEKKSSLSWLWWLLLLAGVIALLWWLIAANTDDEEVVIRFEMRPKIQVEFSLWIVLGEEALKIVIESDLGYPPTHPQSGQPNEDQGPFGACFPKNRNVISHRKSNKCLRSGFKVKTKKPQTEVRGFS